MNAYFTYLRVYSKKMNEIRNIIKYNIPIKCFNQLSTPLQTT